MAGLAHSPGSAVWLGWGNGGQWRGRDQAVLPVLLQQDLPLLALGLTASGQPRHPLYAAKAARPLRLTHSGEELRSGSAHR